MSIYAVTMDRQSTGMLSTEYGRQLIWIGVSLFAGFIIFLLDFRIFEAVGYFAYGFGIFLLILVLFIGIEVNGAKSWFSLGFFQMQPSEFVKTFTILALAKYLSSVNFSFKNLSNLAIAFGIILLPVAIIIYQNDTGSATVFLSLILVLYREGLNPILLAVGILMAAAVLLALGLQNDLVVVGIIAGLTILTFYISNLRRPSLRTIFIQILLSGLTLLVFMIFVNLLFQLSPEIQLIILGSLFLASILAYILLTGFSEPVKRITGYLTIGLFFVVVALSANYVVSNLPTHMNNRIMVLFNPEIDPQGSGYNVIQSKIAIGSGGITGKGFKQGNYTKYKFVPKQETDFIFCTVGEEFGWLGSSLTLIIYFLLLLRIRFMAENAKTRFARAYGYGVLSILFFHLAVNVGMTIGLVPVIGIPLPFFSYGGSSLLGFTVMLAIMLNLFSYRKTVLGSKM